MQKEISDKLAAVNFRLLSLLSVINTSKEVPEAILDSRTLIHESMNILTSIINGESEDAPQHFTKGPHGWATNRNPYD